VTTIPEGARVRVGGRIAAGATPLEVRTFCAAPRMCISRRSESTKAHRRVAVESGRRSEVDVVLTRSRSHLRIAVTRLILKCISRDNALTDLRGDSRTGVGTVQTVEIARNGYVSRRADLAIDRPGVIDYAFSLTPVAPAPSEPTRVTPDVVPIAISTFGYEGSAACRQSSRSES